MLSPGSLRSSGLYVLYGLLGELDSIIKEVVGDFFSILSDSGTGYGFANVLVVNVAPKYLLGFVSVMKST